MKNFFPAFTLGVLGCFAAAGTLRADDELRHVQQSLRDQGFYYGSIDGAPGDETTHAIQRYQIRNGLAVTGQLNTETVASINRNESTVAKSSGGSTGKSGGTITGNGSSADDDRRYAQGNSNDDAPARSTPAPAYSPPPPPARPGTGDYQDDAPAPHAPVNRPDLRAPHDSSANDDRVPRDGIAPSEALSRVFERTPYEFAPPPVQADVLRRAQAILLRDGFYDGEANGRPNPVTFEALSNFQGVNHLRRTARLDAETLAQMGLLQNRPPGPRRGPPPIYEGRLAQ